MNSELRRYGQIRRLPIKSGDWVTLRAKPIQMFIYQVYATQVRARKPNGSDMVSYAPLH